MVFSVSFSSHLAGDPDHVKANVGYVVSTVLSLNTSDELRMLADSLDSYFSATDEYYGDPSEPYAQFKRKSAVKSAGLMRKSLDRNGISGLGKVFLAQAPEVMLSQAQRPNFPRFITIGFIQNIAETSIMPILDSVVSALSRLESRDEMSLMIYTSEDTVKLDVGEVFIFDAGVRLLRAGLLIFSTPPKCLQRPRFF